MSQPPHELAARWLRIAVGIANWEPRDDLIAIAARLLYRADESRRCALDEFGNWEPRSSAEKNYYQTPVLDRLIVKERNRVRSDAAATLPLWPDGKGFAVCLTHDIDGVSQRNALRKVLRRASRLITARGPRAPIVRALAGASIRLALAPWLTDQIAGYERWLQLEESVGAKSTWYLLPSAYDMPHAYDIDYGYDDEMTFEGTHVRVADFVREIGARGFEVGLHGSYLSNTNAPMLEGQRRQVEAVVGRAVSHLRQHYLRFDLSTPAVHAATGFATDSTLGFNTAFGFRCGTSLPFFSYADAGDPANPVLEIPMSLMDGHVIASESLPQAVGTIRRAISCVEEVSGVLVANWHPNNISTPLAFDAYAALLSEASGRRAWFCTVGGLAAWWRERERMVLGAAS